MKELDLRYAQICDCDDSIGGDAGWIVPPEVYGRRIRVLHIHGTNGIKTMRIALNVQNLRRLAGKAPVMKTGTAISGQECMEFRGPEGRMVFGKDYTSIKRRTVRMIRAGVNGKGRLEVWV